MTRDPNPKSPGQDGVWFRLREDGNYLDVSSLGAGTDDPKVAWAPLIWFTYHQLPANAFMITIATNPNDTYHLYVDQSSKVPVGDNTIVDLDKYGLRRNNAIVIEEKKKVDPDDKSDKDKSDKADNDSDKSDKADNDSNKSDKADNDSNKSDKADNDSNKSDKADNDSNKSDNDSNNGDSQDSDDSTGREYHPDFPHKKGYWFVVKDRHGKYIDVSDGATAVNKNDSYIGWNPIPKDSSLPTDHVTLGKIKRKICQSLDLNPQNYMIYASQADDTSDYFSDNHVIDFRSVGLRGNDPMLVKYSIRRGNNSDSGSENGDDGVQEDRGNVVSDPYVNFTRRLQNITSGDWSIYPDSIPNTYNGEILWTDGNASYSYASAPTIQAYKVVRRNPSVYNGTVTQTGLVSASPYYFKLLD